MASGESPRTGLPRAVILTAISEEFRAVRAFLDDSKRVKHPDGTIYQQGSFTAHERTWEVIVAEIGAGNAGAAVEAERAIQFFKPNIVAFVGVAGGLKDVRLGDVVAATKVYGYEAGKAKEDFQTRPEVFRSSYELEQEARATVNDNLWPNRLKTLPDRPPQAFVAPIAAGEKVVSSTYSDTWSLIKQSYGDALAVEMEGAGFLRASHANQRVQAIIVRGISDLVEGKAAADATGSQTMAAERAAAFMFEILANYETSSSHSAQALPNQNAQPTQAVSVQQAHTVSKQQIITRSQFAVPVRKELLYTNLLPLATYPSRLFVANTLYRTKKELWNEIAKFDPVARGICLLRSGQIYCFSNLREAPWNKVCDKGTIECFGTNEWAEADEQERQWLFIELMNSLLSDELRGRGVIFDYAKEVYYFMAGRREVERKLRYFSKKRKTSCDVVKAYESKTEPKHIKYYRHHAFRSRFELIEKKWYLRITPTYFYTSDGRNRSPSHENLLKGIKQQEGNGAVLGQVVMWANLLPSPGLYDQEENSFCFGKLLTFETDYGVIDVAWSKGESKNKKDVFDASQQQLDLANL